MVFTQVMHWTTQTLSDHEVLDFHTPISIKDLLYRQDCEILDAIESVDNHPLGSYLPPKKENKI